MDYKGEWINDRLRLSTFDGTVVLPLKPWDIILIDGDDDLLVYQGDDGSGTILTYILADSVHTQNVLAPLFAPKSALQTPLVENCEHDGWVEEFKIEGSGIGTIPVCQICGMEI